jgi:predicted ATPase
VRELPSGTVTLLFTDIEGSTRLLQELGERYAEVLTEHRRILRDVFSRHGGVEVDTQGDAFFVAFTRASDAVSAAADAQAALAEGPVRVRIGIHTGEPAVTEEGYVGVDVHRTARIMGAGHGGQVLLSETTRQLLDATVELRDLGAHRLKDLSAPQRLHQFGDGEFPPLKTLYQTNLPIQRTPLVGRQHELDEAGVLSRSHRLVTLTGPGGSGKTRLALQIAAEVAEDFPDGVFWVSLAAVSEIELVLPTIAKSIEAKDGVPDHVEAKQMLLLLDNFEQVLGAAPELGDLLQRCPNLKLLVTSRAPLRLSGEWEYQVEPLREADAVDLFTERARAILSRFDPDDSIAEICRRLDRLPLAIELAATQLRILPPRQLLARLDQRLPLLRRGARDAPARQRTLKATIEWSYDLLDPDEQRLFTRLAVFAGSFEAAEAICDAPLELVEGLVERSLVRGWASGRLGMLETIREFAFERLGESDDHHAAARAHFDYFMSLAEDAALKGEGYTPAGLDRLDADRDNFRAAMRWALDEGEPELALRLACSLEGLWVVRAHEEGHRWVTEALESAPDAPPDLRAVGLMCAASTIFLTRDYERSAALAEEALGLFGQLGDKKRVADMLDRLAAPVAHLGDYARAKALAEESLALFREMGDRAGSLYPLSKVAMHEWKRGDREQGLHLTEEALELAREAGNAWWAAGLLHDLAEMAWEEGDLARADTLTRECVSLGHELANAPTLVYGLGLLAVLAAAAGEQARAGRLWGAVEALEESGEASLSTESRSRYEEAILPLSDAALEAGREEGHKMSLDEAVEHALRQRIRIIRTVLAWSCPRECALPSSVGAAVAGSLVSPSSASADEARSRGVMRASGNPHAAGLQTARGLPLPGGFGTRDSGAIEPSTVC